MYKIRFTNSKGSITTETIGNHSDLLKLTFGEAKDSVIESQIGNDMPTSLHDAIATHNEKQVSKLSEEYLAGYNCGYTKPDTKNCNAKYFSNKKSMELWSLGKKHGEEDKLIMPTTGG